MGAWGTGLFENDSVLDALDYLMSSSPEQYIENSFSMFSEGEYLDMDEAAEMLVACVFIDAVLNGINPDITGSEDFRNYVEANKNTDAGSWKNEAVRILKTIISDNSELNELWEEAGEEEYNVWKRPIADLIERLSK